MLLGSDFWGSGVALDIQTKILRKISKSEVSEYSDEEEQEGEGAYPAEEFCIPGDVADDLGFYYSHFIGDGVDAGLVDGVAEEAVAELNGYVFYKDRVGFRRFQRVQGVHVIIACSLLIDVNAVVLYV